MSQTTLGPSSKAAGPLPNTASSSTTATAVDSAAPNLLEEFQKIKEGKALVDWVLNNYEKAKSDRMKVERQWALNMAFFQGNQNLQYMPKGAGPAAGKLFTPPAPSWASRSA